MVKMNQTSASLAATERNFDFANVERCASHQVKPRSVTEAPIRYECTLREVIPISDLPTGGTVVLLDVKLVKVRDELYKNGHIDQQSVDTVGKMGGDHFSLTSDVVELNRF